MVKGKMNATIYKDILDDNLLQRTWKWVKVHLPTGQQPLRTQSG